MKTSSANPSAIKTKAVVRGKALVMEAFGAHNATRALEHLLQPMAQLMIDHGVQLGAATELLKKAMVDAATNHYGIDERSVTDSRIAVLTGVHRKDVRRLREAPILSNAADFIAPLMSISAQVVARWISDPVYLGSRNIARTLARTPRHAKPGESDFTALVAQVSQDVGARAVLEELLRLGIVNLVEDTHVALHRNAFVPRSGVTEAFHFLSANVGDHLATAVHNLRPMQAAPVMLEQSAFSQNLSEEDANELEQTARALWTQVLQQFLQKATFAEKRSSQKPLSNQRIRLGIYFHKATMAAQSATPAPPTSSRKKTKS